MDTEEIISLLYTSQHKSWQENKSIGRARYLPEPDAIRLETKRNDHYYDIEIDACKNYQQFTEWMLLLTEKEWVDDSVFKDFITCLEFAIQEREGVDIRTFFKRNC